MKFFFKFRRCEFCHVFFFFFGSLKLKDIAKGGNQSKIKHSCAAVGFCCLNSQYDNAWMKFFFFFNFADVNFVMVFF